MAEKILVVDVSPSTAGLVRLAPENKGYEVITGADGVEGLSRTLEEAPDLLFLDVTLPKMEGFEACRRLRSHQDPSPTRLPVLLMTVRSQRGDLVKAEEAGADYYLPKAAFTGDELRRAVKALLTRREVERV